jgi:hypothetical protein
MNLKNDLISHLRRRLYINILIGALALLGILYLIQKIQQDDQAQGTSKVLRRSFMFNERLWAALRAPKRLSIDKPRPPEGRPPRVNGMIGLKSDLELSKYQVKVTSGDKKLLLNISAFKVIPKIEYSTEFRCIEGWSEDLHYGGSRFLDFMNFYDLGKKADGKYFSYVGFETPDKEYYVSIDMESMLHEQTVLSYEMNGRPLSVENGNPLRLIIPIKYGIKSIKRIGRIFFSDHRPADYWAERGYDWYSGL